MELISQTFHVQLRATTPAHEAALTTMPGTKEKMKEPQVMLFYSRLQAAAASRALMISSAEQGHHHSSQMGNVSAKGNRSAQALTVSLSAAKSVQDVRKTVLAMIPNTTGGTGECTE